ncbi:hypothetical protein GGX14DRAFT_570268 [Mycena pura]|uniref:Uncharacterized protein n=1 Tax=Mycena pura TaxID=153505 RepID=A0AAD6Y5T4_9AGAR|nr:hypothetical protein GGX14DRAFT_570268 [Mycena pura]
MKALAPLHEADKIRRQHRKDGAQRAADHRRLSLELRLLRAWTLIWTETRAFQGNFHRAHNPLAQTCADDSTSRYSTTHIADSPTIASYSMLPQALLVPIRPTRSIVPHSRRPCQWAPYLDRPDFEWAESIYLRSPDEIKAQLKGIHGSWNPYGTAITIKTYNEFQALLEKSWKYIFESEEFTETIDGEERKFTAYFRDP